MQELQNLGARLEQLAIAKSRFQTSRNVLEDMQGAPEGECARYIACRCLASGILTLGCGYLGAKCNQGGKCSCR